jgi:hypothetical protein
MMIYFYLFFYKVLPVLCLGYIFCGLLEVEVYHFIVSCIFIVLNNEFIEN